MMAKLKTAQQWCFSRIRTKLLVVMTALFIFMLSFAIAMETPISAAGVLPPADSGSTETHEFGIQQLYPTAAGSTSWNSLHWNNGNPRSVTSTR